MLQRLWSRVSGTVERKDHGARPAWAGWRNCFASTVRTKLILAFASLVVIAGMCGAAGLIFVNRVASAFTESSDVTTPLLLESQALIENAHNMRALASSGGGDGSEARLARLAGLRAEGQETDAAIQKMADEARIDVDFASVIGSQEEYAATIERMILAHAREAKIETTIAARTAAVKSARKELERRLREIGSRAEIEIVEAEEKAKVQIQTGEATLEGIGELFSYAATEVEPALQNAYKLMGESTRLQDLTQAALAAGTAAVLEPIENEIKETFKTAASITRKLSSRLHEAQEQASFQSLTNAFDSLSSGLTGPRGLLAGKWSLLEAQAQLEDGERRLNEIEARYFQLLRVLEASVRKQNDASKAQTAGIIAQGWEVISGIVLFALVASLAAILFLAFAILRPLEQLTQKVAAIRESGELTELTDPRMLGQPDELGVLARSFNKMIGELSEARRQLIANSEKEIAKQVLLLKTALANMSQGLCMFDSDDRLIVANDQYARTYGLPPEQVRPGMSLQEVARQRVAAGSHYANVSVERPPRGSIDKKPSETVIELSNGRVVRIHRCPMSGGGFVATHEDITERRRTEEKIAHMARHDALTNLPNRTLFHEKLAEALADSAEGGKIAVLCLDLDHFKSVNDTLGHPIGDALLRAATLRLIGCVRDTDTLSRFGGDEFAIIQKLTEGPDEAGQLAARIIETISAPYDLDGNQVVVGISVGIACFPQDGATPDDLIKHADLALYRAKAEGRGTYRYFEIEMDLSLRARRKLELELRTALAQGQFELFYQPLWDLHRNEITSFEALIRWNHPERGLVEPDDFVPVAEETGLIVPLGAWILKHACQEAASWPENIRVAVNLSPIQFRSADLFKVVVSALKGARLAAGRLDLEITESSLLYEADLAFQTLHRLKDLGVRIVMDDFGTGYSSLSYLRKFPFDKIKIDGSFIHELPTNHESLAIVRAVTGLSSSFGIASTAEGVETPQQLEKVLAEGCTEVQGFLISPPRPASELRALFENSTELRRLVGMRPAQAPPAAKSA